MIKLPDERFRYNESDYDDGFANGFNAAIAEVRRLNATAHPASDGWIEWHGGKCPVQGWQEVDVKFLDGGEEEQCRADDFRWYASGACDDIVAYRLVK